MRTRLKLIMVWIWCVAANKCLCNECTAGTVQNIQSSQAFTELGDTFTMRCFRCCSTISRIMRKNVTCFNSPSHILLKCDKLTEKPNTSSLTFNQCNTSGSKMIDKSKQKIIFKILVWWAYCDLIFPWCFSQRLQMLYLYMSYCTGPSVNSIHKQTVPYVTAE